MLCGWDLCQREKGGSKVGKTKRGKGTKLMVLVDGRGTPLGLHVDSASPSEMKLLIPTLETVKVASSTCSGRPRQNPEILVADKGYDSNQCRKDLADRNIEPAIPARSNNPRATHQDGRRLRRYKKRWIVERTNAWIQNFRRLVVRYESSAEIFTALVHMACALIVLRRISG
jgi:transposase